MSAAPVGVVDGRGDPELSEAAAEVEVDLVDVGLDDPGADRCGARWTVERTRDAVAEVDVELCLAEVRRERRRVVVGVVEIVADRVAEEGVRSEAAVEAGRRGGLDAEERAAGIKVLCNVDNPREAQCFAEQARVARGIAKRAEASLREAGDRALGARVEGAEIGLYPRDELVDVEGRPVLRPVGEVRAVAASAVIEGDVGHDDDER